MSTTISGTTGASLAATVATGVIGPTNLTGAQSGSAPIFGARAWCVFNGVTTGTNAPTAGGNVTSVTRNSAGNYTINFTTAMPSANYAVSVVCKVASNGSTLCFPNIDTSTAPTTSAVVINLSGSGTTTTPIDSTIISVVVFA